MSNWLVIGVCFAALGCGKSSGNKSDKAVPTAKRAAQAEFDKASPSGKCEMVAPRFAKCDNEYLSQAALRATGSKEVAAEVKKRLASKKPSSRTEAAAIVCKGGPTRTKAVYDCWGQSSCQAFATCVLDAEKKAIATEKKRAKSPTITFDPTPGKMPAGDDDDDDDVDDDAEPTKRRDVRITIDSDGKVVTPKAKRKE